MTITKKNGTLIFIYVNFYIMLLNSVNMCTWQMLIFKGITEQFT